MAVHLTHLRIAGFKSFADPVELAILPGLTGVVGPNGCGKSNVADALRWAMGEGHARTLRGAEMDDGSVKYLGHYAASWNVWWPKRPRRPCGQASARPISPLRASRLP